MNESEYRTDEQIRADAFAAFCGYTKQGALYVLRGRPDVAEIGTRRAAREGIKQMERFLEGASS